MFCLQEEGGEGANPIHMTLGIVVLALVLDCFVVAGVYGERVVLTQKESDFGQCWIRLEGAGDANIFIGLIYQLESEVDLECQSCYLHVGILSGLVCCFQVFEVGCFVGG